MERYLDLLPISAGLVALILGAAIGWLVARSRFATAIAELNSKLVLERRINKQLSETVQVQVDAAPRFIQTPNLTPLGEPTREPMVLSG
jgi:hypothetical protein